MISFVLISFVLIIFEKICFVVISFVVISFVTIRFVCAPYQYTCSIAPTTLSFNAENTPAATLNKQFKQTVNVTSSDLHYKDDNA